MRNIFKGQEGMIMKKMVLCEDFVDLYLNWLILEKRGWLVVRGQFRYIEEGDGV